MDSYALNAAPDPYQARQQQHWPPHLLSPPHVHPSQSPFPAPSASDPGQQHFSFFQTQAQAEHQAQQQQHQQDRPPRSSSTPTNGLSLNLSSLTVAPQANLSPINPTATVAGVPTASLSPVTPISPSSNPFGQHHHHLHGHAGQGVMHGHHHQQHHMQSPFSYETQQGAQHQQQQQNSAHYEDSQVPPSSSTGRTANQGHSSRSSSSGTSSQSPHKRGNAANSSSNTSPGPSAVNASTTGSIQANGNGGSAGSNLSINVNVTSTSSMVDESLYEDESRDAAMELVSSASYDDLEVRAAYAAVSSSVADMKGGSSGGAGSPVDGSGSTSGAEDSFVGIMGAGGAMIMGKPLATNNFVTKLYQMISDPKSAQFIAWTELGTSFVVSNVGEFSRSILGSHFKHNNFSSFVRQLNMYGFHKINRTPRAHRTSTDAQTWEFSHNKFLRGRPDLLDEIKRKALEPDPNMKHRVELPGEVAAQLSAMREDNLRMWDQLSAERRKVDKLVGVVGRLWDIIGKSFPNMIGQFPPDLLDSDNPNIFITSPTTNSRYPPPLSMNMHGMHNVSSPNSSPTASDFPPHMHHGGHPHHPQTLSRQQSFQQVRSYRGESTSSTPLPSSPGSISMDLYDDCSGEPPQRVSAKRPRLDDSVNGFVSSDPTLMSTVSSPGSVSGPGLAGLTVPKKSSRARSDSAPLGYGGVMWQGGMSGNGVGRPRSGSGMMPRGVPNIGSMTRANNASTPLLSITTANADLNHR